ncbi:C4-dicarboxylate-binding protein DctP [Tistlia consotensis]|uniref:C4-dicarboxylate-binding protein DctP n=1 Tax=Tistlia consotensis USBA 355 TaxID=560819 RepID=A0A1Y6B4Y5_9PROT|nr:TRAP transporter substrate-binding protein [Tistlia consotensis]SME88020.1 C4-dicarboxylate-binding protein DctP [Tistlia consotensis USBA 355]SNR24376.1 C4-dicarboxylate-binding protein DctP [Tistlia consotensis]
MMRSLTGLLTGAALAGLVAAAPAYAQCDSGEMVIKFSHVVAPQGNPKGEAATKLAQRINDEMNGVACMEVYPNSQLYNDDKVLEAMQLGDVQMAAPSLSKFEKYTKKLRIFDLPFLFKDIEAVDRFQMSDKGQELLGSMKSKGLLGLAYWHNGMKQLSANKPLIEPSDAAGLKFRIQTSDVLEAQFKALGANPQKMAFSEVYGALQTGVVDGQENTWSNIYTKKFYEVQDGITHTDHGIIDYLVVVSADWWTGLKPDVRDKLKKILLEVTRESNEASAAINEDNRKKILAAGTTIRELTPTQREDWVKAVEPVWTQFEGDIGADMIAAAKAANNG